MLFSAVAASALLVSSAAGAISNLKVPTDGELKPGQMITATWDSEKSDTDWVTVVLYSTKPTFNGGFAIANNVKAYENKATFELPDVYPGSGFTLGLVSMSDPSKVLASSPAFAIGAPEPPQPEPATTKVAASATKPAAAASGSASASPTYASMKPIGPGPLSVKPLPLSGSSAASGSASASTAVAFPTGSMAGMYSSLALGSAMSAQATATSIAGYASSGALHPSASASPSPSAHSGAATAVVVPRAVVAVGLGALVLALRSTNGAPLKQPRSSNTPEPPVTKPEDGDDEDEDDFVDDVGSDTELEDFLIGSQSAAGRTTRSKGKNKAAASSAPSSPVAGPSSLVREESISAPAASKKKSNRLTVADHAKLTQEQQAATNSELASLRAQVDQLKADLALSLTNQAAAVDASELQGTVKMLETASNTHGENVHYVHELVMTLRKEVDTMVSRCT
ncbi:hypothetical protein MKEN_00003900 [Mycena kentingensis (nom. inval.)]|nr:hypothetical protein MKEN_00003900 [Mycena kentingensis (nom. inval.)]